MSVQMPKQENRGRIWNIKVWWRKEQSDNVLHDVIETRERMAAALERGGPAWLLEIQIQGKQTEALVDRGASSSFVAPSMLAMLKLPTEDVDVGVRRRVASGSELVVRTIVRKAKFRSGDLETCADLLMAQIPYKSILGTDGLCRESLVWDSGQRRLIAQGDRGDLDLPVVEGPAAVEQTKAKSEKGDSTNPSSGAYDAAQGE